MNDHNLDDLIIDSTAPTKSKAKGLLTILALLIVILIVAIILTRTLLKSPDHAGLDFEENLSVLIAPELQLQHVSEAVNIAKPTETKKASVSAEKEDKTITLPQITQPNEIIENKTDIKPTKQPVQTHKETSDTKGKYFVQVGSFKETPSQRFLSMITSNGFAYHMTSKDANGYKKLLIGPYQTRDEVNKARDTIRKRIHQSAFVVTK